MSSGIACSCCIWISTSFRTCSTGAGCGLRAGPPSPHPFSGERTPRPVAPCLSRSAKYSFASMTVADALLTLQRCRNPRISRSCSARVATGNPSLRKAVFHVGNETAWVSWLMSPSAALRGCCINRKKLHPALVSEGSRPAMNHFPHSAKAALSAAEQHCWAKVWLPHAKRETAAPAMTIKHGALTFLLALAACARAANPDALIEAASARVASTHAAASATAKDFLVVYEDGAVRHDPSGYTARGSVLEEPIVRYFGHAAIVIAKAGFARTIQVWTLHLNTWLIVAEQWTPMPSGDYVRHLSAAPSNEPALPDAKGDDAVAVLAAERIFRESVDLGKSRDAIRSSAYVGIVRDGRLETAASRATRSWNPAKEHRGVLQPEHDLRVRVYGSLGVVTGMVFNEGERVRFLRAYARDESGWKLVAGQSTTIVTQ